MTLKPFQVKLRKAYLVVCPYIARLPAPSKNQKFKLFKAAFIKQRLPIEVQVSLDVLRSPGNVAQCPNRATLYRWLKAYEKHLAGDVSALTKYYQGRQRTVHDWEDQAIELHQTRGKLGYAAIAERLRAQGYGDVTKKQVERFLKTWQEEEQASIDPRIQTIVSLYESLSPDEQKVVLEIQRQVVN